MAPEIGSKRLSQPQVKVQLEPSFVRTPGRPSTIATVVRNGTPCTFLSRKVVLSESVPPIRSKLGNIISSEPRPEMRMGLRYTGVKTVQTPISTLKRPK